MPRAGLLSVPAAFDMLGGEHAVGWEPRTGPYLGHIGPFSPSYVSVFHFVIL